MFTITPPRWLINEGTSCSNFHNFYFQYYLVIQRQSQIRLASFPTSYGVVFLVLWPFVRVRQNEMAFWRVVSQTTSAFPGSEEGDNAET